jgi:phosphatidylcholine synthase
MFLMEARTMVGAIITLVLSALSLTNLPFPHIMRARFMRPVTLFFTAIWVTGMIIGTVTYPDHPHPVRPLLYAGSIYFFVLAFVKLAKDAHDRRLLAQQS